MKESTSKLDMKSLGPQLGKVLKQIGAYRGFIFFLVVAVLYGYILWCINTDSNVPASTSGSSSQVAAQPHIDPSTVQKMLQLQNNSVSVQALFNQARQNPFQE